MKDESPKSFPWEFVFGEGFRRLKQLLFGLGFWLITTEWFGLWPYFIVLGYYIDFCPDILLCICFFFFVFFLDQHSNWIWAISFSFKNYFWQQKTLIDLILLLKFLFYWQKLPWMRFSESRPSPPSTLVLVRFSKHYTHTSQ